MGLNCSSDCVGGKILLWRDPLRRLWRTACRTFAISIIFTLDDQEPATGSWIICDRFIKDISPQDRREDATCLGFADQNALLVPWNRGDIDIRPTQPITKVSRLRQCVGQKPDLHRHKLNGLHQPSINHIPKRKTVPDTQMTRLKHSDQQIF
jgi:hypothetical protein